MFHCWKAPCLLQERDNVISKLRNNIEHLSFKCEAATAQAEALQPYEQRYRDLQACLYSFVSVDCFPTKPCDLHRWAGFETIKKYVVIVTDLSCHLPINSDYKISFFARSQGCIVWTGSTSACAVAWRSMSLEALSEGTACNANKNIVPVQTPAPLNSSSSALANLVMCHDLILHNQKHDVRLTFA